MLTLVAFKFSMNNSLPRLDYQTLLDKYILLSFFFLLIFTIENLLVSNLFYPDNNDITSKQVDVTFIIIFAIIWTFIHLFIVISIYAPYKLFVESWDLVGSRKLQTTSSSNIQYLCQDTNILQKNDSNNKIFSFRK